MDWVEIAKDALEIGTIIAKVAVQAFANGDGSFLDKPLRDLLPHELRITAAKRVADAEAMKKFAIP